MQLNEDTRKMLKSATKKAVKAIVVIVLIISILYFFFVLKLGIDSIRDLQRFTSTFSVIMISLLKIVAVLLVFALLLMLGLWLFRKEDGVEILPFIVAKGEEDRYSGEAISDLLAAEFERIRRIHSFKYEGIKPSNSEGLNLQLLDPKSENLPYLRIFESGTINPSPVSGPDFKSLPKLVTGVGTNTISIGEILIILKQLCPGRYSKNFISGSLQKYGSSIILVARFQDRNNTFIWEVTSKQECHDQDEDGYIPSLVSDLSFKIINDLLAEDKHLSEFMDGDTWLGFKHFTESLNEFQQYKITRDMKHLDLARENCLLAANIERWYGKIYALLYNLGIAYLNEGKSTDAKELFVKVVEHRPDDYAFVDLGHVHGLLGKIDPEIANLWKNKGNAFLELGRTEEAIQAYEKAIELDSKKAESWNNKGMALDNLGRTGEAIEAIEKAIELDPQKAESWYNKGVTLGKLGRTGEAIQAYEKAIEINPKLAPAWYNKGVTLSKLSRTGEAIQAYEKAIELDPKLVPAWYNKGAALRKLGRTEEAIEAYDKAIELDPQKANAWYNKGAALRKLGRTEEAIEAYEKAIELDPQKAEAWNNKGLALDKLGRTKEAIEAYEKAIELALKSATGWYAKGSALGNLGLLKEAIEAYDKAIELDPQKAEAWNNKGLALDKLGRTKEALEAYEKAVELGLKSATLYIYLARVYRKLDREAESIEACKSARDLIETESEYSRACFEAVCGTSDAALDLLRTALEKKQATPDWARRDPDFEFIRDDPRFSALLDKFSADGEKGPE